MVDIPELVVERLRRPGAMVLARNLAFVVAAFVLAPVSAHELNTTAAEAARSLIRHTSDERLPPRLRREIKNDLASASRDDLDFVPGVGQSHHGVPLGAMTISARRAAHSLMRSVLSQQGYLTAIAIMSLEDILRANQPSFTGARRSDDYAFEVFGSPSKSDAWGWKLEGHHLSVNVLHKGAEVRVMPLFLGASPSEIRTGPFAGVETLAAHVEAAFGLVETMTPAQLARLQDDSKPAVAGIIERGRSRAVPAAVGLAAADMNAGQRSLLLGLVGRWLSTFHPAIAATEQQRIEDAGVEALRFAWRGAVARDRRFYFQVTGPTLYLQFDMLPVGAWDSSINHIHSVLGDPVRDYGIDLLRVHHAVDHAPVNEQT